MINRIIYIMISGLFCSCGASLNEICLNYGTISLPKYMYCTKIEIDSVQCGLLIPKWDTVSKVIWERDENYRVTTIYKVIETAHTFRFEDQIEINIHYFPKFNGSSRNIFSYINFKNLTLQKYDEDKTYEYYKSIKLDTIKQFCIIDKIILEKELGEHIQHKYLGDFYIRVVVQGINEKQVKLANEISDSFYHVNSPVNIID